MTPRRVTPLLTALALVSAGTSRAEAQQIHAAATQAIHLINHAGISNRTMRRFKRALLIQLNQQVRPQWGTPKVRFARRVGWKVTILRPAAFRATAPYADEGYGVHSIDGAGRPNALISATGGTDGVSGVLSHELIEMLVDPTGLRLINHWMAEVCDPVSNSSYLIWPTNREADSVLVQDFVTPQWFGQRRSAGQPYDQTQSATRPYDVKYGYDYRLNPATQALDLIAPGGGAG